MRTLTRLAPLAAIALIATMTLTAAPAAAQACLDVVGLWPDGPATSVALDDLGTTAYLASGLKLVVLDVGTPGAPIELGSVVIADGIEGIATSGTYVYVADSTGGLHVIDASVPASPMEVGSFAVSGPSPGQARGVAVSGSYAFIADPLRGLRIIDVSNPSFPSEVKTLNLSGNPEGVAVSGGYAYVAGFGGLRIVDVSVPLFAAEVGWISTGQAARAVAVGGGVAYVADNLSGLLVIDVGVPSAPSVIASLSPANGYYYGSARSLTIDGQHVYVGSQWSGLSIVDVSTPALPVEVGSFASNEEATFWGIAARGGHAFAAGGRTGLRVFDVSTPSNPLQIAVVDTPGHPTKVVVRGNYAYVAEFRKGLRILDLSDPASPTEVGFIATPGDALDVALAGPVALVADGQYSGLRIIDVSNPQALLEIGSVNGDAVMGIEADGRLAYLAAGFTGLPGEFTGIRVIDVSTPSAPADFGLFSLPDGPGAIALSGSRLLVGEPPFDATGFPTFGAGFRIIDVSDPSNPTEVSSIPLDGTVSDLVGVGGFVYTAQTGSNGVHSVDVSVPSAPVLAGSWGVGYHSYQSLSAAGSFAYVLAGEGVWALDFGTPSTPLETGLFPLPLSWRSEAINGSLVTGDVTTLASDVYAARKDGGIFVLSHCGAPPADFDGDGAPDDADNCPSTPNSDQLDSDGDGVGDACDPCVFDPFDDIDGDGICSYPDPCPFDPLNDVDGDGVCGDLDLCPSIFDPIQGDSDGDAIGDLCDNCPDVSNPDQADGDADGVGDACSGPAPGPFVYVANYDDSTVSVIDTATNTPVGGLISVEFFPSSVAITPDGRMAYVTSDGSNSVSVIDTATNTVIGGPITVGISPWGIAITPDGSRAYVANQGDSTVSVIDTSTNTTIGGSIAVGLYPLGIAITPSGDRAFVVNSGDDSVMVIDTASNTAIGSPIVVGSAPRSIAITPNGSRAYVTNQNGGTVSVIDTTTDLTIGGPIAVGLYPAGIAITPDGGRVYVANAGDGTVSVIDTATDTVIGPPIVAGTSPQDIAITPDGSHAYVADYAGYSVIVIDTLANAVVGAPIAGLFGPVSLAITPQAQSDQDGDGIPDDLDACPLDPDNDIDGDGICGDVDICPLDPANDADSDGLCADVDPCPADPLNDIDGDGICGDVDSCPVDPFNDADGDGLCADVDPCPLDPLNDADGDGICGDVDACPLDPANDADGDGLCADMDPCPLDPRNDLEGDGVCGNVDNCPTVVNPLQEDTNGDSVGDACTAPGAGGSGFAYVANRFSSNVSVVDLSTYSSVATVPTGAGPWAVTLAPDGSSAWVTNPDSNSVTVINTADNTVAGTIPVGLQPYGLAITPDGQTVYVTNRNSLSVSVIDTSTLTVTDTLDVGPIARIPVIVTPDGSTVYLGGGGSVLANLLAIDTATNTQVGTVALNGPPREMVIAPAGDRIYVSNQYNAIEVVDVATNTVIDTLSGLSLAIQLAITPDGSRLYVATQGPNAVTIIDTATLTVLGSIPVGLDPTGITISGEKVFVTNYSAGTVSVIDTTTDSVMAVVPVGSHPVGIAIKPEPQADQDGDGIPDSQDICPFDPDNDIDGDGICGDVDACPLDPANDVDGDGICGDVDTCPLDPLNDVDGDGICGDVDVCPADPTNDADGDGVCGDVDNCPTVANLAQTDSNADDIGDACSAPVPALGTGPFVFVASFAANSVSALDATTHSSIGSSLSVGTRPGGIAVLPTGDRIFVANRDSNSVSVINTNDWAGIGDRIPVGSNPWGISASPNGDRLYVTNIGDDTVSVIDPVTNSTVGDPIAVGLRPWDVAFTPDGNFAYVTNSGNGTVSVIDTTSNSVVAPPIPVGFQPYGIAITPGGGRAYVANVSSGTVSVIDTSSNSVVGEAITVGPYPHDVSISPDGARVYVTVSGNNAIVVIDVASNTVIGGPIEVGSGPWSVEFTFSGEHAYVTNFSDSSLSVIDTAAQAVEVPPIGVPLPIGIATTPRSPVGSATRVYWTISAGQNSMIQRSDVDGSNVVDLVTGYGGSPLDIAFDHPRGRVYWTNQAGETIWRAYSDGTSPQQLTANAPGESVTSIAIDSINGKLYWASLNATEIRWMDVVTGATGAVPMLANGIVTELAIDPAAGVLYMLSISSPYQISKVNLDGSGFEVIHSTLHPTTLQSLELDPRAGKIYWFEQLGASFGLKRASTDGTGQEIILSGLKNPSALAVDPFSRHVYWTDWPSTGASRDLKRVRVDGTDVETLTSGLVNPLDLALEFPAPEAGNTQTGIPNSVRPHDSVTGAAPITLTFDEVFVPGETTLTMTSTGPPPPAGLVTGNQSPYYALATTVLFNGSVQVCVSYSETEFNPAAESSLQLSHYLNGSWTNTTTSLNTGSNTICGVTTSLSLFAVLARQPPVADSQSVATNEDVPLGITLTATDPGGSGLTYSVGMQPVTGILSGTGANLVYTPNPNWSGIDSLTFTATDGALVSNEATVTITVSPVNDPPVLGPLTDQSVEEGMSLQFALVASDVEGEAIAYSALGLPTGATLDSVSGQFDYSPGYDVSTAGADAFFDVQLVATDASGGIGSLPLRITVIDVNGGTPPSPDPVVIQPVDPVSGTSPVSIEFSGVQQGGITTVTTTTSGPRPSSGFALRGIGGRSYVEIETTAVVDTPIHLCFNYSVYGISDIRARRLRIFHLVALGGAMSDGSVCGRAAGCMENITDSDLPPDNPNPDTVNDLICGTSNSLSPFFVVEAIEIVGPVDPVAVNTQIQVSLDLGDPNVADSAQWAWGDGSTSAATISAAGVVEGTQTYTAAGIYTPTLTLFLGGLEVGSAEYQYVVVYDPDGGFVTGGGWIDSPPGAYIPDPTLEGRANFGFVAKYKRGQSVPDGQTQFQFKAADLNFHSTSYQWLVIAGKRAKFKGEGEINGEAGYGFMLTGIDGDLQGGGGIDRFRVKIWIAATNEVVYDNEIGVPDGDDPQTALGGGSIVIHSGN